MDVRLKISEADAPALSPRLTNRSNQITHREPVPEEERPLNTNEHERLQVGFTGISEKKIFGSAVLCQIFNLSIAANPKGALKGSLGTKLDPINVGSQLEVYEKGPISNHLVKKGYLSR
jgi:hypothetical protein